MSLTDNTAYKQLEKSLGTYEAVNVMAQKTREISSSLDNRIPLATALSFAARGELPNPKDYPDHRLDRVKNYITYIDDVEIKSAILRSYEKSLAKNNLVYEYKHVEDEPRKARIRIIMNILWDNRPHKEK